jgi:hypothetical protein
MSRIRSESDVALGEEDRGAGLVCGAIERLDKEESGSASDDSEDRDEASGDTFDGMDDKLLHTSAYVAVRGDGRRQ